jgi:hypothetical protein
MHKKFTHYLGLTILMFISISSIGQYQYMGTYDNQGKPNYLLPTRDVLSTTFLSKIAASLPEQRPVPTYNPRLIADGRTETIDVKCPSDVWITFVDEGAGYRNALGYYTFNTDNPPTTAPTASQIKIIFPNASKNGSGGALTPGDKVFLGNFPAKTGIGFVLMADGWNGTVVTAGNWTLYSTSSFNPESNVSKKKHTVLLRDSITNRIVVGFEDIRRDNNGCDNDFNDLIFFTTVTPIECVNKMDSIPDLTTDGRIAFSGNTGGLESKSLGDKIAKRIYGKLQQGTNGEVNYQNMPLLEKGSNYIVSNASSSNNGLRLADLMPTRILDSGYTAYVTTPTDIPFITNAKEVRSVDFTQDGVCKAVAFATKTQGVMYDHTKPMCDRLKGAELLNVENFTLNSLNFVRYTLQQSTGNIEYAMSFSVGKKAGRNSFSFQSNWLNKDYVAEDTLINYQVWGAAPYLCIDMALEILNKLNAIMPVEQFVASAELPKTYFTSGNRNGTNLKLSINNQTIFSTGYFEIEEKANEMATIKTKRTVPFSLNAFNKSSVNLPMSDVFESNVSMFINGKLQDQVYMSDGTWGIDYDSTKTVVKKYNVINDTSKGYIAGDYPVFRNVQIQATTSNYVTAYKVLKGAGVAVNLNDYKSLVFTAKGNAKLKITLAKNSITDFEKQFKYTLPVGNDLKEYRIDLSSFKSANSSTAFDANDIVTAVFAFETFDGRSTTIDAAINNIAFSKKAAEEVAPAVSTLINVFPNPVKGGKFTAKFNSEVNTTATIKITDATSGKVFFTKDVNAVKGENLVPVQMTNLQGLSISILTIEGNGLKLQPQKIVIQQ